MNKLVFSLLAFVLAVTAAYANPGVEMKASPLFKMSLDNSIAKLEGAAEPAAEEMPATEGSDCPSPNRPETEQSSCSPTVCGGNYTCYNSTCNTAITCNGNWTCSGSTCYSTCQSTCSSTCGSTCGSTCAGSGSTYQNGECCNARFYGTISYQNTYYGVPYGTNWAYYLSPYTDLLDFDYWVLIAPYAGGVIFTHGSGYNSDINLGLFRGSNGWYDKTISAPDVNTYRVEAGTSSFYASWGGGSQRPHDNYKQYNSKPAASRQVNITIPIYRK